MPQAEFITNLEPNEVFVFGSNTAGRHGRGAALQAREVFGAVYGVGEGHTGRCYAFPTLDANLNKRSLTELTESVQKLYTACRENPEKIYLLTKVGCGIAAYPEETMRGLFVDHPANLILPIGW